MIEPQFRSIAQLYCEIREESKNIEGSTCYLCMVKSCCTQFCKEFKDIELRRYLKIKIDGLSY